MTVADLPAWLPSWEVLLTISLAWFLLLQAVTVTVWVVAFVWCAITAKDMAMDELQPLVLCLGAVIAVTAALTAYFVQG